MRFVPRHWVTEARPLGPPADPSVATPVSGEALIDLETRLATHAENEADEKADLDEDGKLKESQLPDEVVSISEAAEAGQLVARGGEGGGYVPRYDRVIDINQDFSVLPGVTPNPEIKIQEALDKAGAAAHAASPVEVVLGPGIYTIGSLHVIPGQTTVAAACWLRPHTKLTFRPGAELKLPANLALPAPATEGHVVSTIVPYGGTPKEGISVEGLCIDGNAANQSSLSIKSGHFFGNTVGAVRSRCRVKNIYGTGSGPPGETFHFEDGICSGTRSLFCEADGSGSANTATGFSADNSFDSVWVGCRSHDMKFGQGFTHWQSGRMTYVGCHAWNCAQVGFNSERSNGVVYSACQAGGKSPYIAGTQSPSFPAGQEKLGNRVGFKSFGSSEVVVDSSCIATYNEINAEISTSTVAVGGEPKTRVGSIASTTTLTVTTTTVGLQPGMGVTGEGIPAGTVISAIPDATHITLSAAATATKEGVTFTFDAFRSSWNVRIYGTHRYSTAGSSNVIIRNTLGATEGPQIDCLAFGDTQDTVLEPSMEMIGLGPISIVKDIGEGSGFRQYIWGALHAKGAGGVLYRIQNGPEGTTPLLITALDQLKTMGRVRTRRAIADAAAAITYLDDLIAYTSLTATRVVTLPNAATVANGATSAAEFTVKDESGNCSGAKVIEVKTAGGQTIDGVEVKKIETAYGSLRFYSNGTQWFTA